MVTRKTGSRLLALGVAFGLAAPALAAPKTNLAATNNTIAGPGAISIGIGSSETVFSHPTGSDVCVTVVNTGKAALTVAVTGVSSASPSVPAGGSKAVCSDDTTAIDLTCGEESNCSAQWRVDEN